MKGGVIDLLAQVLVLVGALNWGLVGAFNVDAVTALVPRGLVNTVYTLVGVAALYLIVCRFY